MDVVLGRGVGVGRGKCVFHVYASEHVFVHVVRVGVCMHTRVCMCTSVHECECVHL